MEDKKKNKAVHVYISVLYDSFVTGIITGRIPHCYFGYSTVAANWKLFNL